MAVNITSITKVGNSVTVNFQIYGTGLGTSAVLWGKTSATVQSHVACNMNRGNGNYSCTFTSTCGGSTYAQAYHMESPIAYSSIWSIAMDSCIPSVTTNVVTSISASGGTSGGVATTSGYPITARGVCWNTSANPTIANFKTTDGSGVGSYTSLITGLTQSKLYYVRAYVTYSGGTVYGNQQD